MIFIFCKRGLRTHFINKMNCEFCNNEFKTKTSLIHHQKTAKYCIILQGTDTDPNFTCLKCNKKLSTQNRLYTHEQTCKKHMEDIIRKECEQKLAEKDRIIQEKDRVIEDQKLVIKEFQEEYKNKLEKQNKDLTERIQCMAEKAIAKPSTINKNITTTNQIINNMMPITEAHLQEHIHNLNPIHVQNGASGYAKFALEYPLKDMILCTDFQRRNCKYKDENGNVVSDPEMTKITKRLFSAIKERNEELTNEYSAELQEKWKALNSTGDMNEEEMIEFSIKTNYALEFIMNVLSQKRQANEMADGMKPELFYSFIRELAAGCYRGDK